MATVHRRWRLRTAALVVRARLATSAGGGPTSAAVLEYGWHPYSLRPRRGDSRRRTRAACHLLRGRGVCGVGRCPPAHRGGVGEGGRLGSCGRQAPPIPLGRIRTNRTSREP